MAIKIGQAASSEGMSYDKFIGYTQAKIIAINPTASEIEKLGFNKPSTEPTYIGKDSDDVEQAIIEFWFKFIFNEEEKIIRKRYFLSKTSNKNKEATKSQIIDNYGNTSWLTKEQYENKQLPSYGGIVGNYRLAYKGEAELIDVLRNWLNIPLAIHWNKETKKFDNVTDDKLNDCEISLKVKNYFGDNFKELKSLISKDTSEHQLSILTVIRHKNNKDYQDIFHKTLRVYQDPIVWDKIINKEAEFGMNNNITIVNMPIQKYVSTQQPTVAYNSTTNNATSVAPVNIPNFESAPTDDLPF